MSKNTWYNSTVESFLRQDGLTYAIVWSSFLSRMLKKIIAKKIIILSPISFLTPFSIKIFSSSLPIKKIDTIIQKWALEQSDYFTREDWEYVQYNKLKKTLGYAYENIPYWNSLFRKHNFDPCKMSNFDDFKRIPIISRSEIKSIPTEELVSVHASRNRAVRAFTSGSTAEPLEFYQDTKDIFRRAINNFQEFRYMGVNIDVDSILVINLITHKDLDNLGTRISGNDFEDNEKRKNIIYPLVRSLCPRLLIGTPTYLERFLFFCEKDGFRPKIDRICYMGEIMEISLKKRLEDFFESIVYTTYGTRECSLIGIQCQSGSQHLAPWMNYVELVDGKFIVTTFESEVMPFIRYSIGDEGDILNESCSCGRSSKIIKFNGRVAGTIQLLDGTIFHMMYVFQHIANKYSQTIVKFQFEETVDKKLIMRYVSKNKNKNMTIEKDLEAWFLGVTKGMINVKFCSVDYISPNEANKIPLLIKKKDA